MKKGARKLSFQAHILLGLVGLFVAYQFFFKAVDSGSLWLYFFSFITLGATLHRLKLAYDVYQNHDKGQN